MAAPRILSLSKTLFTTTTTNKQALTSFFLNRTFSSATSKSATSLSLSNFSLLRLRPLASSSSIISLSSALSNPNLRAFSTRQSQNALSDNNPNWSNRPPKETILLDGCDFEHWLVVTEPPPENATRDEIIDSYIKTLAQVVGSEEEARKKIYSVSTKHYFAFGALVSEELSYKIKEIPHVRWVLPDSYLDVKNKDYGGEPFIDGQAVPYDPKYHEEWVRNNAKAQERNRRNDRPRNSDRSRNFERRQPPPREAGGPQGNAGGPQGNMGGPRGNMGGPPNNYQGGGAPMNRPPPNAGYGQNMPPNNAGYGQNMPPNNAGYGQVPPNNAGYGQVPPNNAGYAQNMPPNNVGYGQNMPPQGNPGYAQNAPPNRGGGPPPNYGAYQPPQNTQMGNQNYPPQNNMGGQQGGAYQPQDVPGRDVPNYQ